MRPSSVIPDPPRRFTVLEHRWHGVHWDFLIEEGDSLRTWAIDAPLVDRVVLPARPLAPHRRVYLDYEGPIAGDRGDVRRWDAGTARVEVWTDSRVRLQVAGDQLVGVVEFWESGGTTTVDAPRRWYCRFGKLS